MPLTTRELLAKLIKCEAGGEGDNGMRAVASVIVNRAQVPNGEFARVSNGGDIRAIIEQQGQFTCMKEVVAGAYNAQNVWNMDPEEVHYAIADWAIAGNIFSGVGNSLFYFNPFNPQCPPYFPPGGAGVIFNRINQHCYYSPTSVYATT
ncbi:MULTISPECIES: cell wall hydrolase [unclassified Caproiciproducens]|uniref:cell wall hydrolase n=1 Tax=unclassified Caproiciproducens TaxID=2643836 RepID=UPI0023DBEDB4|nr:cell wall hydrolase [Caproiciproducens sp. CPB-2]MDF1494530.1 cell wall hydrolase [Caproiciproducens sp. CPB-2]